MRSSISVHARRAILPWVAGAGTRRSSVSPRMSATSLRIASTGRSTCPTRNHTPAARSSVVSGTETASRGRASTLSFTSSSGVPVHDEVIDALDRTRNSHRSVRDCGEHDRVVGRCGESDAAAALLGRGHRRPRCIDDDGP